jgi:hypothetical protein
MRAYLRTDGMYDTYEVEPKVMSSTEYEEYIRIENLKTRKAELEAELAQVNTELGITTSQATSETTTEEVKAKRW